MLEWLPQLRRRKAASPFEKKGFLVHTPSPASRTALIFPETAYTSKKIRETEQGEALPETVTTRRLHTSLSRTLTGDCHERTPQRLQIGARRIQIDVGHGEISPRMRPGRISDPSGEDARLTDQRLRLLPRHALARCAQERRNRTAIVCARCLARD